MQLPTVSSRKRAAALATAFSVFAATDALTAFAAELKVDISNSGRPIAEGHDPAFTNWGGTTQSWFAGGSTTAATFDAVTVTLTRVGPNGGGLRTGYWKDGVTNAALNVKLTGDGIMVDGGDSSKGIPSGELGAQIEMRIAGLAPGDHSLLLYLNSWDGILAPNVAPLDILVNGTQVVNDLPVSVRATDNNNATTAYFPVTAVAGQDVVVLIKAETSGAQTSKNVHLNGFEIDVPNAKAKANNPSPSHADEHADADTGSITLGWGTAVLGASSHNVYLGTSESAVSAATTTSPEFRGNQTANSHLAAGINPHLTYYWRVDEVAANGAATKGDVWMFRPRRLAFPGAEGYGRFARGGRGGAVVKVTNLNDSGAGSLRAAIEGATGPRTIVFDVAGLITLQSDIVIDGSMPYITVAGQTAPGKGVTIKRQQFTMSGSRDVIFRYLRLLVGKESGETQNATGMAGVDHCIMDHVSAGWGIDEGLSTRGGKNLTFQRNNLSEALNVAGHQNYPAGTAHGYAASIGGDVGSFHHNLLAHNEGRNWSMAGGLDGAGYFAGKLDLFNNVVYNWAGRTTDGGAHQVNFVNNYYKRGPVNGITTALNPTWDNFPGTQQYYMSGNVMPGYWDESNQAAGRTAAGSNGGSVPTSYSPWVSSAFFPSYATIHTARGAYKQVLSDVGCNQPQIDNRDTRIIGETLNGTYTYTGSVSGKKGLPDTTADVGGWESYPTTTRPTGFDTDNDGMPDWWESIKGLSPTSPSGNFTEANADADGNGYTNLEEYLNWKAAPNHEVNTGSSIDIDLHALCRGYLNTSPGFTLASPSGGTVTLVSNRYARFTPSGAANALGGFTFTVTDNQGDSMTRSVGVRVIGSGLATPPAPSGLSATAGNAQVSLTWSAVSGATSYNIKRSTTSGSGYVTVGTAAGSAFTNTGLTNGTTYYYVVSTVNSAGEGANSVQASATPAGGGVFSVYEDFDYGANVNLSAKNGGSGWGLPWSNAAINNGVNLAAGLSYGNLQTSGGAAQFGGNASSTVVFTRQFASSLGSSGAGARWLSLLYLNTGDANAEARIGFYGGMGADANGNTSTSSSGLPHPMDLGRAPASTGAADQIHLYLGSTVVTSGVATPRGSSPALLLVKFNLSGNSSTADTAQLWVNPNLANGESGLGSAQATWTAAADLELVNGIRFQNAASGQMTIDEIRLGGTYASVTPAVQTIPQDVVASAYNQQVVLGWSPVSGATSYRVKRSTTNGGPYATVATVTSPSHIDTGLTNGTTYHYVVSSLNGSTESANSTQVSAAPSGIPVVTVQAESGTISGGTFDSNNAGFNGTAFANLGVTGGSLQFSGLSGGASGGAATLTIRFALGVANTRTGNLVVNGASQAITFPTTGSWTTWTTMNVPITLNAGSSNTIRFESTGQDLANIDEITLAP